MTTDSSTFGRGFRTRRGDSLAGGVLRAFRGVRLGRGSPTAAARRLRRHRRLLLEIFLAGNLLLLAVDIFFAHSVNGFREPSEWVPLGFSLLGGGFVAGLLLSGLRPDVPASRIAGGTVGLLSIGLGIWGALAHLEGQFFRTRTLESLVYAAPFAAPLAYSGIGFLLLVNRVFGSGFAWGRWVIGFAAGGFAGCFLLALLDHEQNGFFFWTEWIPVAAAALGLSTLGVVAYRDHPDPALVRLALAVLGVEALVGILGFAMHLEAGIRTIGDRTLEAFIHGAPPFAPLLFMDLALLAGIGLLALPEEAPAGADRLWTAVS